MVSPLSRKDPRWAAKRQGRRLLALHPLDAAEVKPGQMRVDGGEQPRHRPRVLADGDACLLEKVMPFIPRGPPFQEECQPLCALFGTVRGRLAHVGRHFQPLDLLPRVHLHAAAQGRPLHGDTRQIEGEAAAPAQEIDRGGLPVLRRGRGAWAAGVDSRRGGVAGNKRSDRRTARGGT